MRSSLDDISSKEASPDGRGKQKKIEVFFVFLLVLVANQRSLVMSKGAYLGL